MKKVLLFLLAFFCVALTSKVNAQSCSVSNPVVQNVVVNSNGNSCTITFDLTFNIGQNNGNKWKAIYIWNAATYNNVPSNFYGSNGLKVPKTSAINASGALAVIAINETTSSTTTLPNYPGDVTDPTSFLSNRTYSSDGTTITIEGISISAPSCDASVSLKADVGASNAQSFSQFGCLSKGELAFTANEPQIQAYNLGCGASRAVVATFITTEPRTVFFKLFKDNGDGQLTASDTAATNLVGGPYETTTAFFAANNDYRSTDDYAYTVQPGEQFDVWIVAYTSGVANVGAELVTNTCAPLPVDFSSFNAARKNQTSVGLTWETSFEQNNKGFYVQRNTNGEWKNVAFVFSSADGGNSSQTLRYAYNDPNNLNSISYYRIQQVDIDGRARYSDVRAVRGEEQASKIMLFPNPGTGGKVNVMFNDEAAAKDVMVYDATGRVVKSFKSVSGNSLSINGLKPGMYSLQVTNVASATTSSEKFIIQN